MKTRLVQSRNRFSSRRLFTSVVSEAILLVQCLDWHSFFILCCFQITFLGLSFCLVGIQRLFSDILVSSEHYLPPPFWFISNETCHHLTSHSITGHLPFYWLVVQNSLNCFYLKICRWIMIKVPSKVSASPKSETRRWKYSSSNVSILSRNGDFISKVRHTQ